MLHAADRHVALGHNLEHRGLHLRRCPVDLVGEHEVGHDRSEFGVEALGAGSIDARTDDVGRHEVRSELQARERAADGAGQRLDGQRLGDAGHALEQAMALCEQAHHHALDEPFLTDDHPFDLEHHAFEGGGIGRRSVGGRCRHRTITVASPQLLLLTCTTVRDAALGFLQGLLIVLRDSGLTGLVVVLDEVETLQRVRTDMRERALNALRQLIDEIDAGRYPGLALIITGTPAFFDGPQGVQRLPPLASRLATDFKTDARFDNPRAVQLRLPGFDLDALCTLGSRVRNIYADGAADRSRIQECAGDDYIADLARAVTGTLGGRVGVAPRVFLKKLVGDVLDRIDQFPEFDPREHYALTVSDGELTDVERAARSGSDPDEVELEL